MRVYVKGGLYYNTLQDVETCCNIAHCIINTKCVICITIGYRHNVLRCSFPRWIGGKQKTPAIAGEGLCDSVLWLLERDQ